MYTSFPFKIKTLNLKAPYVLTAIISLMLPVFSESTVIKYTLSDQHFADVILVTLGGETAPRGCFVSI